MTLGEKIVRVMDTRGWKQVELSKRSGVAQSSISNVIARNACTRETGVRLAKTLGVTIDWLLDDDADWPPVEREHLHHPLVQAVASQFAVQLAVISVLDVPERERVLNAAVVLARLDFLAGKLSPGQKDRVQAVYQELLRLDKEAQSREDAEHMSKRIAFAPTPWARDFLAALWLPLGRDPRGHDDTTT